MRCGFDLSQPEFRGEGAVVISTGDKSFTVSGLAGFAEGWFAGGTISWTSGANSESVGRVVRHASGEIQLAAAPRFAVAPGDEFAVTAGCDKSFATCGAKFANRDNFRGFPHMPGPDAVLAGPSSTNSGGSRL